MKIFQSLRNLFDISRPRFWFYFAGPFLVGFAAVAKWQLPEFVDYRFWYSLFYFLFPANVLIYAVNDLFDFDTDQHNAKKRGYEVSHDESKKTWLALIVIGSLLLSAPLFVFAPTWTARAVVLLALTLCIMYSAPPFRFKSRAYIDSTSNGFYVLPGLYAVLLAGRTGDIPVGVVLAVIAAWIWTIAMHLFSAIPDIEADRKAGLRTTAVTFGERASLIVCALLWLACGVFMAVTTLPILVIMSTYALAPLAVLGGKIKLFTMYRIFPIINTVVGLILFWFVILI